MLVGGGLTRRLEAQWVPTLSRALPKVFCAFETSFRSLLIASKPALTGFWSLVMVKLARCGSDAVVSRDW